MSLNTSSQKPKMHVEKLDLSFLTIGKEPSSDVYELNKSQPRSKLVSIACYESPRANSPFEV